MGVCINMKEVEFGKEQGLVGSPHLQRDSGELLHNERGLDMKVTEHGVRGPTAKELDSNSIDVFVERV